VRAEVGHQPLNRAVITSTGLDIYRYICNGWFGPTFSDVHSSSLGQVYRNWATCHFRLKATQHVVHRLGAELVAYC
jgi:hypothetical protein